jgi:hypothetical protein
MAESSEEKYNRIQRDIQTAILKNYPNPERKGCLGAAVIKGLAANPDGVTAEDDVNPESAWHHVTHCSPCYAEFLDARAEYRREAVRRRTTRRSIVVSCLVAAAAGAGWVIVERDRPRFVEIDLERFMATRSVGDNGSPGVPTIPTGRVHVRLKLPRDSAEGLYSVQLLKDGAAEPFFSTTAQSSRAGNGRSISLDARVLVGPGRYTLGVRNDDRGVWRYCPVVMVAR